jgi:hypothetical protein
MPTPPSSQPAPAAPALPAPVRSGTEALRVMLLATGRPLEAETLAFFLDDDGVGGVITVVSGTTDPDSVLSVTECLARAAEGSARARTLVLASVRPGGGPDAGDPQRWHRLDGIVADHGLRLLDWFVIGAHGVHCPRDLAGQPERWSAPRRR